MPWQPWTQRPAAQRAAAELRKDPARSDNLIAEIAGVSKQTVRRTRAILEERYLIAGVPLSQRQGRPYPRHISRTPRQVAGSAPRMADAAAAIDSLSVIRIIPRPCAHCREPFPYVTGMPYCCTACSRAAAGRRLSLAQTDLAMDRPNVPDPGHPQPRIPYLPTPPDFSKGLCTRARPSMRGYWTSDDHEEREAAARLCQDCPVKPGCEQWALSLPLSDTSAIYAGMTPAERRRKRQQLLKALAAQAAGGPRIAPRWLPPGTEAPED